MAVSVDAQIIESQTNIVTKEKIVKEKKRTWYMRVGVQASKLAFDDDYLEDSDGESLKSVAGYSLDFGFQKPIRNKGAYWGMTFGLGSRGFKYVSEGEDYDESYKYSEKFMAHNIQYSPFTFGWKIKLADKLYLDPHIGLYLSMDYTGKIKAKLESSEYGDAEESWGIYEEGEDGYWDEDSDVYWCHGDIGMNFGVGLWYDRFNFDINYQRGFINAIGGIGGDTYDGHKSKASNVMFRLGIAF